MATNYRLFGDTALRELISLMKVFNLKTKYVDALPDEGESGILYFVFNSAATGQNLCDEYLWIERETGEFGWELVGSATLQIDLANYAKKSDFDTLKQYLDNLSEQVAQLSGGGLTDIEFDTTDAPELTFTPSKDGTTAKVKVTTDLSDYAKTEDIPVIEEMTPAEVDSAWDEVMNG